MAMTLRPVTSSSTTAAVVTTLRRPAARFSAMPGSGPTAATAMGNATMAWGSPSVSVKTKTNQKGDNASSQPPSAAHAQPARAPRRPLGVDRLERPAVQTRVRLAHGGLIQPEHASDAGDRGGRERVFLAEQSGEARPERWIVRDQVGPLSGVALEAVDREPN